MSLEKEIPVTSLPISRALYSAGVFDWMSKWHWVEDDDGWHLIDFEKWQWSCDTMSHFSCCSAFMPEELLKLIKKESL